MKKKKVILGLSGGVDSSVAAYLLLQQGYNVEAVFMKNWEEDDTDEYCTAAVDLADAQKVCEQLEIKLHTVNFSADYWDRVFEYFLQEYSAGRTPNPDIVCNKEIKFKVFLEHARSLGADYLATGHYAQLRHTDSVVRLIKGADQNKDQTYFLHTLNQDQLSNTLFPVGHLEKSSVRAIAEELDLKNKDKKDSTGICFIGEKRFKDFLQQFIPAQKGNIITLDGQVIGEHDGVMYYTIGQRQGLSIGGMKDGTGEPWFVAEKKVDTNELIVVQGNNHPALFKESLKASQLTWICGSMPAKQFRCAAKTRYRQLDQSCMVEMNDDLSCQVRFDAPQRAITPGQSVVFYDKDECLGGGIIQE